MFCSAAPIPTRLYINSQNHCRRYLFKKFVTANSPKFSSSPLSIYLSSPLRTMAVGNCVLSSDDVVVKSPTDRRLYRFIQLPNGLCALLVHDPQIYSDEPSGDGKTENTGDEDDDEDEDEEDDDEDEDEDEDDDEEDEDEDEDENEEVNKSKGSAQKKVSECSEQIESEMLEIIDIQTLLSMAILLSFNGLFAGGGGNVCRNWEFFGS